LDVSERAVDSRGHTIDFLLSARRDAAASKRFFHKALHQPHSVNLRTIAMETNRAYPKGLAEMTGDGELWRFAQPRQCKYLNNIVEQGHRRIKRLTRPGSGFGGLWIARQTLARFEVVAMARRKQVENIGRNDCRAKPPLPPSCSRSQRDDLIWTAFDLNRSSTGVCYRTSL
jgi:IS6 family transposase